MFPSVLHLLWWPHHWLLFLKALGEGIISFSHTTSISGAHWLNLPTIFLCLCVCSEEASQVTNSTLLYILHNFRGIQQYCAELTQQWYCGVNATLISFPAAHQRHLIVASTCQITLNSKGVAAMQEDTPIKRAKCCHYCHLYQAHSLPISLYFTPVIFIFYSPTGCCQSDRHE